MSHQEHIFSWPTEITPREIDQLYNHVHHAQIAYLLERGRSQFLTECNIPLDGYLARGLPILITNLNIVFLRELTLGPVIVTCEEVNIEGRDIFMQQRIVNARGKICVEAAVGLMFYSREAKRGVPPPDDFLAGVCDYLVDPVPQSSLRVLNS